MRRDDQAVRGGRVLQISPYYPPHLGGVERVAQALAETLARRREVEVLTTAIPAAGGGSPASAATSAARPVPVRRFRALELAGTPVSPGIFAALLREPRGSVWHVHCCSALIPEQVMLAAWLRRRRYVLHFHADVAPSGPLGRLLPAYKKHAFGRAVRAAARVLVLSGDQAAFVERTYQVPAGRISVVPKGVAEAQFREPRPARADGGALKVLYVGRLGVEKNVGRLIDAVSLAQQDVQLRVVGDGPQRAELIRRAAQAGVEVEFSGPLYGAALDLAYEQADLFVLPSDGEGMPMAVLEAMAAGLPVLATDVPGTRELVRGRGSLVAPEAAALAAGLDELAADAPLRTRLARQCAEAARDYSWEASADLVERIYDEVGA
jgi:glycosyltransferase involved in cell wall biosynthesis